MKVKHPVIGNVVFAKAVQYPLRPVGAGHVQGSAFDAAYGSKQMCLVLLKALLHVIDLGDLPSKGFQQLLMLPASRADRKCPLSAQK